MYCCFTVRKKMVLEIAVLQSDDGGMGSLLTVSKRWWLELHFTVNKMVFEVAVLQ